MTDAAIATPVLASEQSPPSRDWSISFLFVTSDDPPPAQVLHDCMYFCTILVLLTFVLSTASGNASQVDKLWSISPVVYSCICAFHVPTPRTLLMSALVTIWGVRLSYNFHRRGGYKNSLPRLWEGEEDYRWAALRSGRVPYLRFCSKPLPWLVFNLLLVSGYQNLLLLLIVSPILLVASNDSPCSNDGVAADGRALEGSSSSSLNWLDGVAALLFLSFVVLETVADRQQYEFQTEKYRRIREGPINIGDGEYADGFRQSGLFSVVRKPNYAAEQGAWMSFYLFSISSGLADSGGRGCRLMNWSACGWVLLVSLFRGSGWLTEHLSVEKYGERYEAYQQRVPLYVPRLWMMGGGGIWFASKQQKEKAS